MRATSLTILFMAAGCGGTSVPSSSPVPSSAFQNTKSPVVSGQSPSTRVDSWSGWKAFTNVSPGPWMSKTHGNRFVEIYANDIALKAYKSPGVALPVGSILVKPSWENLDGKAGAEGPLFVMEKMPAGFAPDSDDWFYAFQWAQPPAKWAAKLGTQVDWRSPSDKVEYCSDCHDVINRGLGMPPKERILVPKPTP